MMKRILLIASVILSLSVFVTGCSNKDQSQTPDPVGQNTPSVTDQAATAAPDQDPTSAPEPTKVPDPTATPSPDPGIVVDMETVAKNFYWDGSTELINIVLDVFPVNDALAVLQFKYFNATDDVEIPLDYCYAFTCNIGGKATYSNDKVGLSILVDNEGSADITFTEDAYKQLAGHYVASGEGFASTEAIIELLRNVPEASLGDFDIVNEKDEIEEFYLSDWFHELILFRDGKPYRDFIAVDDLSAVCENKDGKYRLIFGSMANTLEKTTYEFIDGDDEEDYYVFETPVICPCIAGGTELTIGQTSTVSVSSDLDLTESISLKSSDENILSTDGTNITGVSEGTAALDVEIKYGDCTKQYTLEITVFDAASADEDESIDLGELKLVDPELTTLVDSVSGNYTMNIYVNDGLYSVDIISSDDGLTVHHWSYIGEADASDENVINLNGCYTIENYSDDTYSETIVFEDQPATIRRDANGAWFWNDPYADAGKDCRFE